MWAHTLSLTLQTSQRLTELSYIYRSHFFRPPLLHRVAAVCTGALHQIDGMTEQSFGAASGLVGISLSGFATCA